MEKLELIKVKELESLGFVRYENWDFTNPPTKHYRLDRNGIIYRAFVEQSNGKPYYMKLGVVINEDRGIVDRWRDCCSEGSIERKIQFNENQCSLAMNNQN